MIDIPIFCTEEECHDWAAGFHLGAGAGGGAFAPPFAGCLPLLEILLYIYCIVQHVAFAPPPPPPLEQNPKCCPGLYKYFKRQSLPNRSDTNLGDALSLDAYAAVQRVMEEATTTKGRKCKYTHFTPEQRVNSYYILIISTFFLAFTLLDSSKKFQNYGTPFLVAIYHMHST